MLIVCLAVFSGCASIVSKSNYRVTVNSTPPGAKITVSDDDGFEVYSGITPAKFKLKAGAGYFKKASYTVTFEKDGFDKRTIPILFNLDGWYLGNLLIGGFIGFLIIDPATGAMWKIDRDYYNETLTNTVESKGEASLKIIELDEVPESWKDNLERIN
jgi:hypothetical protein